MTHLPDDGCAAVAPSRQHASFAQDINSASLFSRSQDSINITDRGKGQTFGGTRNDELSS